ncbi:hypothetical protein CALCODRAFT_448495 [Calocera cornea HHB12733]|uniref:Gpr1 family protein n=1 Tax=Calocera cornea HHB12733 TaxID=1353952 RepID=A0A165IFF3_9BASI|nr:hypothetical protein CALCODRAFT_448495 [Calocera cornea HHB12733]
MSETELKHDSSNMDVPVLIRQDTQPALPTYHRRFGNPAPLGVFSFGAPVFMLSMFMVGTDGVTTTNVIVGMALICGGFGQFCAGMWEMACGNTFGATLFGLFSTFWGSYGLIFIPGTGILAAYEATPETAAQLHNAIGIYLITWFILGVLLTLGALRTSVAMLSLAIMICSTILVLAVSEFTQKVSVTKAAGAMGIVTALLTFYVGAASLYTEDNTIFTLPTGPFARKGEHGHHGHQA